MLRWQTGLGPSAGQGFEACVAYCLNLARMSSCPYMTTPLRNILCSHLVFSQHLHRFKKMMRAMIPAAITATFQSRSASSPSSHGKQRLSL